MSDNNMIGEEELKRAEELLGTSKSKRKKLQSSGKSSSSGKSGGAVGRFISDISKKPVSMISLLAAVLVLVFGIIYFSPIMFPLDSLGMSYQDLQKNCRNTELYKTVFSSFNCELPKITYASESDSKYKKQLNFFSAPISNNFSSALIGIQGSTRKTDDELVALRFLYSDDGESEKLFYFYCMVTKAVLPELSDYEAEEFISQLASDSNFIIKNDIACRMTKQTMSDKTYYVLDFAPASEYEKLT